MSTLLELTRTAVSGHDLISIENALVAGYCNVHNLHPAEDTPVGDAAAAGRNETELGVLFQDADDWTLDAIVMAFETLVPADEAKRYGEVFTPEVITSFMAAQAADRAIEAGFDLREATVIDPAAGCGALLVAALRELVARTGEDACDVAARLTGIDISADSIRRAHILIGLTCLTLGDTATPKPRLVVADTLTTDLDAALDGRQEHTIVLGNPPYVRFQDLDEEKRDRLRTRWHVCDKGNFNLYFPFFEVAEQVAVEGGIIAYITPNGFFTSLSGRALRTWMTDHDWLDDIVDFRHHRVFAAMTYTAITFATRRTPRTRRQIGYIDVAGTDGLEHLDDTWRRTGVNRIDSAHLGGHAWRLVGPAAAAHIDAITHTGRPLGDVAVIRYGLATLRDRLYTLDGTRSDDGSYLKTYKGKTYTIEAGLTRRCVKVSGIMDADALAAAKTRVIYPYRIDDGVATILDETHLAETYPEAYAYLCAIRGELAQRDNGRKTYPAWYAYGRSQSLVPIEDKLLTPLYADKPRFLRHTSPTDLFINGCSVSPGPDTDMETLSWVLNSGVCHYYIESTANSISNGFYAYQKSQLSGLGIPQLTETQRRRLRNATDAGDIDDLLAAIYGITLPKAYRR